MPRTGSGTALLERLRKWTAWLEATGHSPKTIRDYRYWLLRYAADTLVDPWDVTEDDIVSYIASQPAQGMSRHMFLRAMHSYWSWAEPRAERNPTSRLHLRRPRQGAPDVLSPEECRAILRAAFRHDPKRGWTLMLVWATGARIGSIVALRPGDIRDGVVHFRAAKGGRTYSTGAVRAVEVAAAHLAEDDRLVTVCPETVRTWLRRAARDAGIRRRVYPHLFRHTLATDLGRVADPRSVQEALGWADLSQYPRYVHTDQHRVRAFLEAVR